MRCHIEPSQHVNSRPRLPRWHKREIYVSPEQRSCDDSASCESAAELCANLWAFQPALDRWKTSACATKRFLFGDAIFLAQPTDICWPIILSIVKRRRHVVLLHSSTPKRRIAARLEILPFSIEERPACCACISAIKISIASGRRVQSLIIEASALAFCYRSRLP